MVDAVASARACPIASPFPAQVAFCALVDVGEEPAAFEEELALLSPQACARRRRELLLGRAAAHQAIARLCGSSAGPIGRGERGQPLWPGELVGTISHTRGLAVAAVARREHCEGLGVDVERRDRRVDLGVTRLVATAPERLFIEQGDAALRLKQLFSAKEALFKALYPLGGVYLGYKDAELAWLGGGFEAVLRKQAASSYPAGSRVPVGCRIDEEHVLAWVCLPAAAISP